MDFAGIRMNIARLCRLLSLVCLIYSFRRQNKDMFYFTICMFQLSMFKDWMVISRQVICWCKLPSQYNISIMLVKENLKIQCCFYLFPTVYWRKKTCILHSTDKELNWLEVIFVVKYEFESIYNFKGSRVVPASLPTNLAIAMLCTIGFPSTSSTGIWPSGVSAEI